MQPNTTTPATPGAEGASPGEDEDDGDGLDQLSVRSTRSYHVNKSPGKKSPRKGSVQSQHGLTPPPSTTFSPPIAQGQFLSPGEQRYDPYEYAQTATYEGLGIAGGVAPQGYTFAPMPQYTASPTMPAGPVPAQYLRSPMMLAPQPLQPLQGNPEIQRQPRMVPVPRMQSPAVAQLPFQPCVQMKHAPQRLVRQNTQPLPPQMLYDENALRQAALLQMQRQQQQLPPEYLSPVALPQSPQRLPRPISRSVPSSPEKKKFANQLTQVFELDIMSIPTPLVSSPLHPPKYSARAVQQVPQTRQQPQQQEPQQQRITSHLRGISFLDELFGGGDPETEATPKAKGPLASDGTLREGLSGDDDIDALEEDVNTWLEGAGNLTEGTGWLDEVVLN